VLDDDARLGPMLSSVRCSLFPTAPARACRLSAHFAACNLVTPTPVAVAGLHHLQRLRGNLNRFALLPLARVLPGPVGTAWSVLFHRGVSVNVGTTSVDSSVYVRDVGGPLPPQCPSAPLAPCPLVLVAVLALLYVHAMHACARNRLPYTGVYNTGYTGVYIRCSCHTRVLYTV
jgi:hypothetical protein